MGLRQEDSPGEPIPIDLEWSCPNIRKKWRLVNDSTSPAELRMRLCGRSPAEASSPLVSHTFEGAEALAIQAFREDRSLGLIQGVCKKKYPEIPSGFISHVVNKLITLGILSMGEPTEENTSPRPRRGCLRHDVEWYEHPNGGWLLIWQNPDHSTDLRYVEVTDDEKEIVEALKYQSPQAIANEFDVELDDLLRFRQSMAVAGLLEGVSVPKSKSRKFHPKQLLYLKKEVWNPDQFLSNAIPNLHWLWSKPILLTLIGFLSISMSALLHRIDEVFIQGQTQLASQGIWAALLFILFSIFVVAMHELGHAFTLKHYGGVVPWFGVILMALMPLAYTDTTDSYRLSRSRRMQVVMAGVIVQLLLASLGFWIWTIAVQGTWLQIGGYFLMAASLITLAINCNPLAKFDGYYFLMAVTGINELREKSFEQYKDWFCLQRSQYQGLTALGLALYAPLSLVYIWFVFGFLLLAIFRFCADNIPMTAIALLIGWLVYYFGWGDN